MRRETLWRKGKDEVRGEQRREGGKEWTGGRNWNEDGG